MTFNQKVYAIITIALVIFWSAFIGVLVWGVEKYFAGG